MFNMRDWPGARWSAPEGGLPARQLITKGTVKHRLEETNVKHRMATNVKHCLATNVKHSKQLIQDLKSITHTRERNWWLPRPGMSCSMQGPSGVGKRSQGRGTESWKFTHIHWKLSTFKTSWLLPNFQRRAGSANVRVCESQRFWCCHLHWRARRRGLRPCAWLLFQVQYAVPEGGVPFIVLQFSRQKKARVCLIINRQYHSDYSVNNDVDDGDKYEDVPNYHHHHLCSQQ